MATAHIIHDFLGFTSTRLGSEVSCPRTLPRKNPEDPVRVEPRTPGLQVKHLTTEPRGTPTALSKTEITISAIVHCPLQMLLTWIISLRLCLVVEEHISLTFNDYNVKGFGNIVDKGKTGDHQHFLLCPEPCLPYQGQICSYVPPSI